MPAVKPISRCSASVSPKPRVAISPVVAPVRSISALVACVVPWPKARDAASKFFRPEALRAGGDGDGVEHALFQLARRGGRLGGADIAALVHEHEIGERAADIDAEIHVANAIECFPGPLQALRDRGDEVHSRPIAATALDYLPCEAERGDS